jgi:phospholipid/cholesterol/gamma-HCH transport system substrate-binding protein
MPSQKELRWSQLKVGILALCALTALTVLIFLLAGSTGGLFTKKMNLRTYFENASGLKVGSPVTLNGVTIGNVISVKILPHHDPDAVEVVLRVGSQYLPSLHTDSTVAINTAGVLGDSFLDITSVHATGPEPTENATLKAVPKPTIQDVVQSSQDGIQAINKLIPKVSTLMDSLNSDKKGTAGMLLNDPEMARKLSMTVNQLQSITQAIASGKGSIGKLINDDDLYNKANDTIAKLDEIAAGLNRGEGSAGKLLKDDTLYKNLNAALTNTNELLGGINSGKGSLGKLAKDPALANKVEETVTHLNGILKGFEEGKGTLGQMFQNRSLYDNLDKTLNDTGQLITAIRKDPKTYLTIHVKVF